MDSSPPIDSILPAMEQLDAKLLQTDHDTFSTQLVQETAVEIAEEHSIDSDELLDQFAVFLFITEPDSNDDPEFYQQLITYLHQRHLDRNP